MSKGYWVNNRDKISEKPVAQVVWQKLSAFKADLFSSFHSNSYQFDYNQTAGRCITFKHLILFNQLCDLGSLTILEGD